MRKKKLRIKSIKIINRVTELLTILSQVLEKIFRNNKVRVCSKVEDYTHLVNMRMLTNALTRYSLNIKNKIDMNLRIKLTHLEIK